MSSVGRAYWPTTRWGSHTCRTRVESTSVRPPTEPRTRRRMSDHRRSPRVDIENVSIAMAIGLIVLLDRTAHTWFGGLPRGRQAPGEGLATGR